MTCPLCRQPAAWEGNPWRPFCSERCQLTDWGSWAAEQYRLPGPNLMMELPADEGEEPEDPLRGTHH